MKYVSENEGGDVQCEYLQYVFLVIILRNHRFFVKLHQKENVGLQLLIR